MAFIRLLMRTAAASNKKELRQYHDMLKTVYQRVARLKKQGKTLEQVIAAKPTKEFDDQWEGGLFNGDDWIRIIYPAVK